MMSFSDFYRRTPGPCRRLLAGLCAVVLPAIAQEEAPELPETPAQRELHFIDALLTRGWSDYAALATEQYGRNNPGDAKRIKLIQAKLLSQQGKFAEARDMVKDLPATDEVTLAALVNMARNMHARGKKDEASKIFEQVFAQYKDNLPNDPDLVMELGEAGYVYYQMKLDAKDYPAAIKALEFPVKALGRQMKKVAGEYDPDDPRILEIEEHNKGVRTSVRLLQAKQGFAMIDQARALAGKKEEQAKVLAAASKLAEKLSYVYDIAFGHAIVMMMQVEQVKGNAAGIDEILSRYRVDLDRMDEMLAADQRDNSPKAGARFIKGEVHFEKAKAAATKEAAAAAIKVAGNEFANVFVKYSGSLWEAKAADRFNELKKFASEKHGIEIQMPATGKGVAEALMRLANESLAQGRHAIAVEQFGRLFAQYPEFKGSAPQYANYAKALKGLGDHLAVRAVCGYIADRLAGRDEGALNALRIVAGGYLEEYIKREAEYAKKNQPEPTPFEDLRHLPLFEMISRAFPADPNAADSLYIVAETAFVKGKREVAIPLYTEITEKFPGTKAFVKAANRLAFMQYEEKNFEAAGNLFAQLAKSMPEGMEKAQAEFRLSNCLRSSGKPEESVALLNELIRTLDPARKPSPFYTAEFKAKSEELLQDVYYTLALGYLKGGESGDDKAAANQKAAADTLAKFLAEYPKSPKAPDALFQLGRMQIKIGKIDDAVKTFNDLAQKYPASDEGKDALYSLAKAAVEAGKPEVAQDAVKKMLAQAGSYKASQFLRVGRFMMDNKFFPEAEGCMQAVVKHADTAASPDFLQEALMNLAESSLRQGKFDAAIAASADMLKKFPQTGYLFRLKLVEAEALAKLKKHDSCTAALAVVYEQGWKHDKTGNLVLQADLIAALNEIERGDASKAAGAYMRIVMFGERERPENAALIRKATFAGIEQARKVSPKPNWEAVRQFADFYLEYFPGDEKSSELRRTRAEAITNGAADTSKAPSTP